jgi:signal peptidase I
MAKSESKHKQTKGQDGGAKTSKRAAPAGADRFWDFVKQMAIALVLALCIKTSIVEAYKIPSGSMEDTLLVGDFLLANKFLYGSRLPIPFVDLRLPDIRDPKPGDVVIFKYPLDPNVNYIKRCVAVAGQTVEIRNKQLYVDGEPIPLPAHGKFDSGGRDPFVHPFGSQLGTRDNMPLLKVPPDSLFVMGDNRDRSSDSRFWGFVPRENILGQAMIVHWSWRHDDRAPVTSWRDPLSYVRSLGYNLVHFHERVRWGRLFRTIN